MIEKNGTDSTAVQTFISDILGLYLAGKEAST